MDDSDQPTTRRGNLKFKMNGRYSSRVKYSSSYIQLYFFLFFFNYRSFSVTSPIVASFIVVSLEFTRCQTFSSQSSCRQRGKNSRRIIVSRSNVTRLPRATNMNHYYTYGCTLAKWPQHGDRSRSLRGCVNQLVLREELII